MYGNGPRAFHDMVTAIRMSWWVEILSELAKGED